MRAADCGGTCCCRCPRSTLADGTTEPWQNRKVTSSKVNLALRLACVMIGCCEKGRTPPAKQRVGSTMPGLRSAYIPRDRHRNDQIRATQAVGLGVPWRAGHRHRPAELRRVCRIRHAACDPVTHHGDCFVNARWVVLYIGHQARTLNRAGGYSVYRF